MTKLHPFQYEGALQIRNFGGRALLADDMGLGKTIQALYWLHRTPKHRPAIVVCPSSMKYTWQAEAMMHYRMRAEVLEGNRRKTDRELPGPVVILNYDILRSWLPLLLRTPPRTVIIDECHYIKTPGAQRTRKVLQLTREADSVVGLSGTPLTNRPIELWTVLRAIRPDLFPSREDYAWRYCAPRWTFWGWRYDGATHLKELHRILRENVMIRRTKKEVLKDLPPKKREFYCSRLSMKDQREYDRAQHDFVNWLQNISPSKAKKAKKAEALVKIGYLIRLAARLKLPWSAQWVRDFFEAHPGKKLVVFTGHTFVIDYLNEQFASRTVIIDGRVRGRKREESVRLFRSNPRKDLLLGNWKAAGVGLTLVSAHHIGAFDLPWTPGDLLQGEDRIHRIGQKEDCFIHYLSLLQTIEEKQIALLRRKTKVLDAVLDGKSVSKDVDIFNELLETFKKGI